MRIRIIVSVAAMAAAAAAVAVTAAVSHQAAAPPARHAAINHVVPAGCPAVLRAVGDVARKAGINLATGSMTAHVVRDEELAWSGELLGSWKPSASPTAAHVRLGEDVLTASTDLPLRGNADAVKFIADLQKLQADCA